MGAGVQISALRVSLLLCQCLQLCNALWLASLAASVQLSSYALSYLGCRCPWGDTAASVIVHSRAASYIYPRPSPTPCRWLGTSRRIRRARIAARRRRATRDIREHLARLHQLGIGWHRHELLATAKDGEAPTMLQVVPEELRGAFRPPAPRRNDIGIILTCRGGRTWQRRVAAGLQWGAVRNLFAGDFMRNAEQYEIAHDGNAVNLDDHLPNVADGEAIRATYRRIRPERQNSRSPPRRQAPVAPDLPAPLRDPVVQHGNIEVDSIDIEMVTRHGGSYYLPVELGEFHQAVGWEEVTVAQLAAVLTEKYGFLWGDGLCGVAVRRRLIPDGSSMSDVLRMTAPLQVVPPDVFGASKRPRSRTRSPTPDTPPLPGRVGVLRHWVPPCRPETIGSVLNCKDLVHFAKFTDEVQQGWLTVVWGTNVSTLKLPRVPSYARTGELARRIYATAPAIDPNRHCLTFLISDGGILRSDIPYATAELPGLAILVTEKAGSAQTRGSQSEREVIGLCKQAVGDKLKINQIRLMYKGDQNLANRLDKVRGDPDRLRQITLEGAARYGMTSPSTSPPTRSTSPSKSTGTSDGWQTVNRKKSGSPTVPTTASGDGSYKLVQEEWSHPILPKVTLGCDGVLLAPSQATAAQYGRLLSQAKHETAIIAVQPVAEATKIERITFTISSTSGKQELKRVAQGYLCNFGPCQKPVAYIGAIATVHRQQSATSTGIVKLTVPKKYVAAATWQQWDSVINPSGVLKLLAKQQPPLIPQDAFRFSRTSEDVECLLRIRTASLPAWLSPPRCPSLA